MVLHKFIQQLLKAPKFPGRDYLIEQLPKWFLKKPEGPVIVKTRFGFSIKVDPTTDLNIENVIYERGVYEQAITDFVQHTLNPGDTFVDAGANIGFLSLVAAAKVGAEGCVHAFEPVQSTFEILQENVQLNNFNQVKLHPFGLGAKKESVHIFSEEQNRGGASIVNERSNQKELIQINTLDEVLRSQKVDMLKVDVEGYEFQVLKGAQNILETSQPILILEFSKDRNNSADNFEMIRWLAEVYGGCSFYRFEKGKERISKLLDCKSKTVGFPEHDNIICFPKK